MLAKPIRNVTVSRDTPRKPDTPKVSAIQILFCATKAYIEHAGIAAVSVLEATLSRPVHVHLMSCDADYESVARMRKSLSGYQGSQLSHYQVKPELLDGAFVDRHVSKETYLRILAPEILPSSIGKIIYLDCDLIALDDLGPLFDVDLEGRAVGAVPDVDWRAMADDGRLADLGIGRERCYVNAGVLVMDLDRWRRDDLSGQILAFAREKGSLLTYHDQDALNLVLKDDIAVLDRRWNMQALMFSRWFKRSLPTEYAATKAARRSPAIIHFTTAAKPWNFRTYTPYRSQYYRFRAKSAWRNNPPPLADARHRLEHKASLLALRGGIDIYSIARFAQRLRSGWRDLLS